MHPLETYLTSLAETRASAAGTQETSYYPALHAVLNEAGTSLKPKVRCILQLANKGAGNPDGGLYTPDQFQKLTDAEPIPGQKPSRGAIEVKPVKDDAWVTAQTGQVSKYWAAYGQVLVTNYRDFVLIGRDTEGKPLKIGSYHLAADQKAFWKLALHPKKASKEQGDRFLDFLRLVMLSPAILADPKDVAWVLAYYAREAKARIDAQTDLATLSTIREALAQALGLNFEGDKGNHFFKSSLVQTLFYGVFSAWVLWSKQHPPITKGKFDWKLAQWSLRVPMIRVLFEQVATPGKLGPLGLIEVLDWTAAALNRVDRASFFAKFQEQEAVQYFYEPFLEAFDPDLRKQLGVWYTPVEVVKYMVARVDRVLRQELGLADGLADPNVYVLDPGCGTGAYLVEVLNTIAATLNATGNDALVGHDVKRAAMERIFGFELLPAPFVISHLQLGLLLQRLNAPLKEDGSERVGVYLTNSLTGWHPPKGPKQHLIFPEMEAERDAADKVKLEKPILVVLGNPPYNAFAGVSPAEEEGLVEPYKHGLVSEWGIKKFNLDDLYVRFFRLAERRITDGKPGRGIVSYISNFSYLSDPSFVVMRRRFLNEFSKLWFDCMNGDSRETGKLTPEGKPDPSVFSTPSNREGIRVGTTICLMVRPSTSGAQGEASVRYRDLWGVNKRKELLNSLTLSPFDAQYEPVHPDAASRYSFRPGVVAASYLDWPRVTELCAVAPMNGLMEKRGGALMAIDQLALATRMQSYLDPKLDWDQYKALESGLTDSRGRFDPKKAREKAIKAEKFDEHRLVKYALRPFDSRWAYYTAVRPVWNEPRPNLWNQLWPGNLFLVTRPAAVASPEGKFTYLTGLLGDNDALRGHAYYFPFRLRHAEPDDGHHGKIKAREDVPSKDPVANISEAARTYLQHLGLTDIDKDPLVASLIWLHTLAITYSPAYLRENTDGVLRDWPRIPLPATKDALVASASLGQQLAALLSDETGLLGVTDGPIRSELRFIAPITAVTGKAFDPSTDLEITAGWSHPGKDGVTMPGRGKAVERDYTEEEHLAIIKGALSEGPTMEGALATLGNKTLDIYLNENAYWSNVPENVWDFTIGGYQVLKKWLSYREKKMLGRPVTPDEAREFTNMARRLAAIRLLEPKLDTNYAIASSAAYKWPSRLAGEKKISAGA